MGQAWVWPAYAQTQPCWRPSRIFENKTVTHKLILILIIIIKLSHKQTTNQANKQASRQANTQTNKQANTHKQTSKQTNKQTNEWTNIVNQTSKQASRQASRQAVSQASKQATNADGHSVTESTMQQWWLSLTLPGCDWRMSRACGHSAHHSNPVGETFHRQSGGSALQPEIWKDSTLPSGKRGLNSTLNSILLSAHGCWL